MHFHVRASLPVRHIMWMFAENHHILTHPTISVCRAAPRCCKKLDYVKMIGQTVVPGQIP